MANVPYSSIPEVAPTMNGTGASPVSVEAATPNAFGAGVGTAMENAGAQTDQLAQKFTNIYNESTARDATTATATALSQEQARFLQLKGNDAVNGFKQHQDNIAQIVKDGGNGLSLNANTMYQTNTSYIADKTLMTSASHVGQQAEFAEKTSLTGAIDSGINGFAMNPSDPSNIHKIFDNSISLDHANGVSDKDVVQANASKNFGAAFTKAIEVNQYSNPALANKLYDQAMTGSYVAPDGTKIPFLDASQRAVVSEKMHSANATMNANAAYSNILGGNPVPPPIGGGMNEVNVKSAVASDAQARGIDPNLSMMVSGLESSFGRTSSNIGGVKGMTANDLAGQVSNQNTKLAEAITVAKNAVGSNPTPAQIYTAYQQGPGGGAALLKTLQTNPNASAADVLEPLYKNRDQAVSALTGNGMPANATVKQVTDFLQKKCDNMYGQVKCDTVDANGNPIDLGKAIVKPYQTPGIPQQPTSNPVEALKQWNDLYAARQAQINAMPFGELRNSVQEHFNADHANLKKSVEVYNDQNTDAIRTVTSQPDFYSVNDSRITPEMRSFMNQDQKAYNAVYQQAERNRLVAKGEAGGKTPLGDGFSYLQQQAYAGKLTATDMFYHLGNDLTQAGFDKLKGVVKPQVGGDVSDNDAMASFLKYGHERIVHSSIFDNTPDAEKAYQGWYSDVSKAIDAKQKAGIPVSQLIDPNSKDYVGGNIGQFLIPVQKQLGDRAQRINVGIQNEKTVAPLRTAGESPEVYLARIQ